MCFDTQAFLSLSLNGRSQHAIRQDTIIGLQGFFFLVEFLPVCTGRAQELKNHSSSTIPHINTGCGIPTENTVVENRETLNGWSHAPKYILQINEKPPQPRILTRGCRILTEHRTMSFHTQVFLSLSLPTLTVGPTRQRFSFR